MSHIKRSQIHLASFTSVLFPLCGFVYLGCARVRKQVFSSMLNTGIQYLPVDSRQTSVQEYLASHAAKSLIPWRKRKSEPVCTRYVHLHYAGGAAIQPATHLLRFCSLPAATRGDYHKKDERKMRIELFHNPTGAFRRKADYNYENKMEMCSGTGLNGPHLFRTVHGM